MISRIVVDMNNITISFKEDGLFKLAKKFLNIEINLEALEVSDLHIPYKTRRANRGAIVIEPEGQKKDLFDRPPAELKKLVQGIIWREEHFKETTLKSIATREGYSQGYISQTIFKCFETLQNAGLCG